MIINPWFYKEHPVTSEMLMPYAGFVYVIQDTETNKLYIGKKFVWSYRKVKGKNRRKKQESNWKTYYSSNKWIKQESKIDPMRFKREILHLCKNEGETNWRELEEIVKRNAIYDSKYINDNLLRKVFS